MNSSITGDQFTPTATQNMPNCIPSNQREQIKVSRELMDKAQHLLTGITHPTLAIIVCNFYGSGDEGQVEFGELLDADNNLLTLDLEQEQTNTFIGLTEEILSECFGSWEDGVGAEGSVQFIRKEPEPEVVIHFGEVEVQYTDYQLNK